MIDHGALVAAAHGIARSPHWPIVEREFRTAHPRCAACRDDAPEASVQVHHVNPFHYLHDPAINRPDLELDQRNLIGLCEDEEGRPAQDHHIDLGHLGDFRQGNLAVREDASGRYHGMTNDAIRSDADWRSEERNGRIRPLDKMNAEDKEEFRIRLWRELPPDPAVIARFGIILTLLEPT